LNWVIDNRRPLRIWGRATHVDKNWVPFENFIAPLVDERDRIVMLFGVAYYVEPLRRI
jgi:hypothetical protein